MTDPKPVSNYNLSGNSNKDKDGKAVEPRVKRVEQVTEATVVQRKKPLLRRIGETFTGDDSRTVANYVMFEVILPAAKQMISDAVSGGIERLLFGEGARSTRSGTRYTPYNRVSSNVSKPEPRKISDRGRATHDFTEIVLESRGEAEKVRDDLIANTEQYEVSRVSDLYDLVGITGSFQDDRWGWYREDIPSMGVRRVHDGYLIALPKPSPVE